MTMLSGRLPRPVRPSPAARVDVTLAPGRHGVTVRLGDATVEALPEGALWVEAASTLVVSDLHLEKGSAFARRGQMLPPYDSRTALERLRALTAALSPARIVSLGDSFHDLGGPDRMAEADVDALRALTAATEWIWIEGNHDPRPPAHLGGSAARELVLAGLVLRHEPVPGTGAGEVSGHLHPCAKVAGRGRSIRARCFATDGRRMIMPAFGAYAGGLNLCDPAFASVFPHGAMALLAARGRVTPAPPERLIPDA